MTEEDENISDEEWYERYWKNASIGDPSYDNVRRPLPESGLWKAIKFWVLAGTCIGLIKGCDYLASKVNPLHPGYHHSVNGAYKYYSQKKERDDFDRYLKSTRENR